MNVLLVNIWLTNHFPEAPSEWGKMNKNACMEESMDAPEKKQKSLKNVQFKQNQKRRKVEEDKVFF